MIIVLILLGVFVGNTPLPWTFRMEFNTQYVCVILLYCLIDFKHIDHPALLIWDGEPQDATSENIYSWLDTDSYNNVTSHTFDSSHVCSFGVSSRDDSSHTFHSSDVCSHTCDSGYVHSHRIGF